MDTFITTFSATLGIILGLVTVGIMPTLVGAGLRMVTTRKWQARKYRSLIARGQVAAAQWAVGHGFATEE